MDSEILLVAGAAIGVLVAVAVGVIRWIRSRTHPKSVLESEAISSGDADLTSGLAKTRAGFWARLRDAWSEDAAPDDRLRRLEEALLAADVGVKATQLLLASVRDVVGEPVDANSLRNVLRNQMVALLAPPPEIEWKGTPHVVLVAGVNGVGKTTSIAKLAQRYQNDGKKVLLVAADTFRAAAAEQLATWAERLGVDCIRHQDGADPSAVAFDGVSAGIARAAEVVIVDTAGRLHVKQHLIDELKKIVRVIGKRIEAAPQEVLLVIDATTGQNALAQARVFQEALSPTGIVLTKLDGTAKGGVVFAIRAELGIPVRYIGIGEGLDDLQAFEPERFVDALLVETETASRC